MQQQYPSTRGYAGVLSIKCSREIQLVLLCVSVSSLLSTGADTAFLPLKPLSLFLHLSSPSSLTPSVHPASPQPPPPPNHSSTAHNVSSMLVTWRELTPPISNHSFLFFHLGATFILFSLFFLSTLSPPPTS